MPAIDTILPVIGIVGVLLFLVAGIMYPRYSKALISRFVLWQKEFPEGVLSAYLNDLNECTYTIMKHGVVRHSLGEAIILVLEQSYVQNTPRGSAGFFREYIYVLAVEEEQEELCRFMEENSNYKYWTTLDYNSLNLYHIKSLLRFRKHFQRIAESGQE